MADFAGLASSMAGTVELGRQLSIALQAQIECWDDAEDQYLLDVVFDISATSSILSELHDIVNNDRIAAGDTGRTSLLFRDDGLNEIQTLALKCEILYQIIVVLVQKSVKPKPGKLKLKRSDMASSGFKKLTAVDILHGLNWDWLAPRINRCQEQLRWLKISLLLNLQMANLAQLQLNGTTPRPPGTFDKELGLMATARKLRNRQLYLARKIAKEQARVVAANKPESPASSASCSAIEFAAPTQSLDAESSSDNPSMPIPDQPKAVSLAATVSSVSTAVENDEAQSPEPTIQGSGPLQLAVPAETEAAAAIDTITPVKNNSSDPRKNGADCMVPQQQQTSWKVDDFLVCPVTGKSKQDRNSGDDIDNPAPEVTGTPGQPAKDNLTNERVLTAETLAHISLVERSSFFSRLLPSWARRRTDIFGPSNADKFLSDTPSSDLAAYVVEAGAGDIGTPIKVPFGHQRLKYGLKNVLKKGGSWSGYLAMSSVQRGVVDAAVRFASAQTHRVCTCIAVQEFKKDGQQAYYLVFFALEEPPLPILLLDCMGRKFRLPYEACKTREGIKSLLTDCFAHIDGLALPVREGQYDLCKAVGDEIHILPSLWASTVRPGDEIIMRMWPPTESHPALRGRQPPGFMPVVGGMARPPAACIPPPQTPSGFPVPSPSPPRWMPAPPPPPPGRMPVPPPPPLGWMSGGKRRKSRNRVNRRDFARYTEYPGDKYRPRYNNSDDEENEIDEQEEGEFLCVVDFEKDFLEPFRRIQEQNEEDDESKSGLAHLLRRCTYMTDVDSEMLARHFGGSNMSPENGYDSDSDSSFSTESSVY